MRLGVGSISTGIQAARESGFFQSIRRFDSPAWGMESIFLCLGGSVRDENEDLFGVRLSQRCLSGQDCFRRTLLFYWSIPLFSIGISNSIPSGATSLP
jgi:hypothetical protein